MTKPFQTNTKVKWEWGKGTAVGYIRDKFTSETTKTIKSTEVTRRASKQNPAYLVEQEDGAEALKSHSELTKA